MLARSEAEKWASAARLTYNPSIGTVAPILKVRNLGKGPRDIESDNSHGDSPGRPQRLAS